MNRQPRNLDNMEKVSLNLLVRLISKVHIVITLVLLYTYYFHEYHYITLIMFKTYVTFEKLSNKSQIKIYFIKR